MKALIDRYFIAWNAHDGAQLSGLFADGASYLGPTTRMAIHAYDLQPVIESLAAQFSDFAFEVGRPIGDAERCAVEWTLTGTNDGPIRAGIASTGRKLHVPGVDVIEARDGKIFAVRRMYDRRTMMEQLGLQVLVEPFQQG